MYVATERGTSDNTEATRFSECAHDQRRRLEAEDCDSILCAQLISGGRRRIRPPRCLAHARPTMCCIRLVYILVPRSQPARDGTELTEAARRLQNRKGIERIHARGGAIRVCCDCPVSILSRCVCVHAFVHVSACIFIVHAGLEAAVLDWYTVQKQIH